jgi:hypothetical protein
MRRSYRAHRYLRYVGMVSPLVGMQTRFVAIDFAELSF